MSIGEQEDRVIHTGCPAMDVICHLDLDGAAGTCQGYKVDPGGLTQP